MLLAFVYLICRNTSPVLGAFYIYCVILVKANITKRTGDEVAEIYRLIDTKYHTKRCFNSRVQFETKIDKV